MKKFLCMAVAMMAVFFGGGCDLPGFSGNSAILYEDAEKYTMGGAQLAADGITTLELSWMSGSVTVGYHTENTIVISETANKTLDEKTTMYYWVDGDTLRIKFAQSGKFRFGKLEKALTVWLPEGMELDGFSADTVSAKVDVDGLVAQKAEVDTISGDIVLAGVTLTKSAEFGTTSGKINVDISGELSKVSADTVSGRMEFTLAAAKQVTLDSTSGAVSLEMEAAPDEISVDTVSGDVDLRLPGAGKVDLDSTSGKIKIALQTAPDALSVDTVSGNVVFVLPENVDCTIDLGTVSGKLKSEIPMKKDGEHYIFGAGTKKYKVGTTSGDVSVGCE